MIARPGATNRSLPRVPRAPMTFSEKVLDYARMAAGVDAYVRAPLRDDYDQRIRRHVAERESIWLDLMRRTVFNGTVEPYGEMFRIAGCTYGDLENSVRREGLEPTLKKLHGEGVRLSNDEFKGRAEIVRSGRSIPATNADFRNPVAGAGKSRIESRSGGSRGPSTRTPQSPEFHVYLDGYRLMASRELYGGDTVRIHVKPLLPGTAGIVPALGHGRLGIPWHRWFSFGGPASDSAHYRALTNMLVGLGRLRGRQVPFPEHLPQNDFRPVAHAIAEARAKGLPCYTAAFSSAGARVAVAAKELSLDISGTVFALSAEAVTQAKRQAVLDAGCRVANRYWISEIGPIGFGCLALEGRGVHIMRDAIAVFGHRRPAPYGDSEVNALQFTTLLPYAPHVLINVEMDDAGRIEACECDCEFARMGYTHALFDIFSFGKLTGSGMTLAGTDMVRLLERELPARFGGGPGDYQLVQRQGGPQTEMVLRVSPRVEGTEPDEVKTFVLQQVRGLFGGAEASRVWRHSEALRVERREPAMTGRGKILALHLEAESEHDQNPAT